VTDTPPAPDRPDLTRAERTERAAAYRAAATRARRAAERARTIAARPARHPAPTRIDGLPTNDQVAATLALHPRLALRAADQYDELADAWDRHAAHLTRTTDR
jgi:hypothetical protein